MPIAKSEVEVGGQYKTSRNQERVVLGCNEDCKVVYAFRGGETKGPFKNREACSLERFADACEAKTGVVSKGQLDSITQQCNAQDQLGGGDCCF